MSELGEKQECRRVYNQIVSGYTRSKLWGEELYIKHFSEQDFARFEDDFEFFLIEAKRKGLSNEKGKLEFLIEEGHWSRQEEDTIKDNKISIAGLKTQMIDVRKNGNPMQIRGLIETIGRVKDKTYALERARKEIMGTTAEDYAQRKNNEKVIYYAFFKDKKFKESFFGNEEEFLDMDQEQLYEAIKCYNQKMEFFTEKWIKKIAALPFFLNSFFLCNDDPRIFYGKPVTILTIYQTDLFSKGKYYKSILSEVESDGPPPELYEEGVQLVVNWYDTQWSILDAKRRNARHQAKISANKSKGRASRGGGGRGRR